MYEYLRSIKYMHEHLRSTSHTWITLPVFSITNRFKNQPNFRFSFHCFKAANDIANQQAFIGLRSCWMCTLGCCVALLLNQYDLGNVRLPFDIIAICVS